MHRPLHFRLVALPALLLALAVAGRAEAQQLSVTAADASVTVQNGIADATFRVAVANAGAALPVVVVTFADGTSTQVNDVPAEGSARGAVETHTFDVSQTPSHNLPIPVTVSYTVDGAAVSQTMTLILQSQQ